MIAAVLLFPSFYRGAPEMDEGTLVAYPTLVIDGEVPGRDFETFYGPGEPYVVAGAFEVFGSTLTAERAVGFAFRLMIVLALFALVLPWGRPAALAAGVIAPVAMLPVGVSALAIFCGLALSLLGLAVLSRAVLRRGEVDRSRLTLLAGLASGLALAFRPDLAPAIALGALALLIGGERRTWAGYAIGAALGLIPLIAWLAIVGPDKLHLLADDLTASRSGRHLPLPGAGSADGQLLAASLAATALIVALGAVLVWLYRRKPRARIVLAVGLFALLLVPTALQRADVAHIAPLACLALGFFPAALVTSLARPSAFKSPLAGVVCASAAGVIALMGVVGLGHSTGPTARDQLSNPTADGTAFEVHQGDRSYRLGSETAARDLNALLPKAAARTSPGDGLFVGPTDLRRTNYADTFLYYMLPELRPASFYTELNAGSANSADSGLADDIRDADALILTTRWNHWDEPNDSRIPGSSKPNRVVKRDFCERAREGSYGLYLRCERSQAPPPKG